MQISSNWEHLLYRHSPWAVNRLRKQTFPLTHVPPPSTSVFTSMHAFHTRKYKSLKRLPFVHRLRIPTFTWKTAKIKKNTFHQTDRAVDCCLLKLFTKLNSWLERQRVSKRRNENEHEDVPLTLSGWAQFSMRAHMVCSIPTRRWDRSLSLIFVVCLESYTW